MLAIAAAVLAVAFLFATRAHQQNSASSVFGMMPRETVALAVIPSIDSLRAQWQRTDLFALWQEPAVQEFLRKPRANAAIFPAFGTTLDELSQLHATEVFAAVSEHEGTAPRLLGGFRFKKNPVDVEAITNHWTAKFLGIDAGAKASAGEYEKHRIISRHAGSSTLFTTITGEWFFAANDLEPLQRLLDCVDGRTIDPAKSLSGDETFAAAFAQMPKTYVTICYGRPDRLRATIPALAEVRSVSVATWFEGGLMRDRTFVTMPRKIEGSVGQHALALGSADTFLYINTLANLAATALDASVSSRWFQPISVALAAAEITPAEWSAAFGSELTITGEWPQNSRLPSLVATLPVKDATSAQQISEKLALQATTAGIDQQTKEGVRYFAAPPIGRMFAVSPTIGISDKLLAFGADELPIQTAMQRAQANAPGLASVPLFQKTQATLPSPQQSLSYFDTAQFYTRLDSALKPILLMGAAFLPKVNEAVDLAKIPDAAVITKHLQPIAMSQRYVDVGYLSESTGPFTLSGILAGGILLSHFGLEMTRQNPPNAPAAGWNGTGFRSPQTSPAATPAPTP